MLIENCKFASRDDCLGLTSRTLNCMLWLSRAALCLFADAPSNRIDDGF